MTREQFLLEMDEILELPSGTLKGPEKLEDLEQWNSMSMLGYIALADTHSGVKISPRQIVQCSTVDDLLKLARVEDAPGTDSLQAARD
jgi:acyl carrier protein